MKLYTCVLAALASFNYFADKSHSMKYLLFIILSCFIMRPAAAQDTIHAPIPDTINRTLTVVNTQPVSDLDIPIRINLKPLYTWANNFIDTVYTSPNYPNDWVMDGCETRYQYRFIRGPFNFKAFNNILYVSFSGYYGVRGSTRACTGIGNSPWTPACSCGLGAEKPRRIDAGFTIQFRMLPDYRLGLIVNRMEPVAVDKCSVCFFGKDITQTVATTLRTELDTSIAQMQRQLQTFSLKPYLQMVWDTLQSNYPMPGFGYLNVQPEAMRISQAEMRRDSLFLSLGLSAKPELAQLPALQRRPLPNITDFRQRFGFRLFIAQHLPYDSLNALINHKVAGMELQAGKGIFKKKIVIDSVRLLGGGNRIYIQVSLSKGIRGKFYLEGKPVWDPLKQELRIDSLDYQVQSKQALVKTASWLLDGTITQKLNEYTHFNLQSRIAEMNKTLFKQMNRNIYTGVNSRGYLSQLQLDDIKASEKGIFVAAAASGKLWIDIDADALMKRFLK